VRTSFPPAHGPVSRDRYGDQGVVRRQVLIAGGRQMYDHTDVGRGAKSVWIKVSPAFSETARRIPWKRISWATGQYSSQARLIINSRTAARIVSVFKK
jgi:hypothetical protein